MRENFSLKPCLYIRVFARSHDGEPPIWVFETVCYRDFAGRIRFFAVLIAMFWGVDRYALYIPWRAQVDIHEFLTWRRDRFGLIPVKIQSGIRLRKLLDAVLVRVLEKVIRRERYFVVIPAYQNHRRRGRNRGTKFVAAPLLAEGVDLAAYQSLYTPSSPSLGYRMSRRPERLRVRPVEFIMTVYSPYFAYMIASI